MNGDKFTLDIDAQEAISLYRILLLGEGSGMPGSLAVLMRALERYLYSQCSIEDMERIVRDTKNGRIGEYR